MDRREWWRHRIVKVRKTRSPIRRDRNYKNFEVMTPNISNVKTMRITSRPWLCGLLIAIMCATSAHAANGTWTNDASSVWSAGTNWLDGIIGNGTDSTADFSTIAITTNRTVTLDSS